MFTEFKKLKSNNATFFCFTPLVSLATFIIEIVLAIFILYKNRITKSSGLVIGILVLLGVFQLAEYMMCEVSHPEVWNKIGSAAITLLPVMILHLVTLITKRSIWPTVGYISGALIIGAIFFFPVALLPVCTGNFVVLHFDNTFNIFYDFFYTAALLLGLGILIRYWNNKDISHQAVKWSMVGYLSFLVPTFLVYIIIAATRQGVASIMCGFAVFAAFIIVFKILPTLPDIHLRSDKKN